MEKIIGNTFLAFLILFVTYIGISILPEGILPTTDREQIITRNISEIAQQGWSFIKPILQLSFIILILEYVIKKLPSEPFKTIIPENIDVRAVIALVVTVSFCVASLAGSQMAELLERVALVVIGFYFGGLSKKEEI